MIVGFVLVGCPAEDVDPDPDPDPVDPDDPAPEPDDPDRVVHAQAQDVGSWDPPQCWLTDPEQVTQNAYDYLHKRSADGAEWVPQLATEWEQIDEYTTRFHLRDDVYFHDGTQLTAEDVAHHYQRILDGTEEEYILRAQYADWIADIEVVDEFTVDFTSETPDALKHYKISQQNNGAGIVSKAYFEDVGVDGVHREPMGSGPYKMEEWVRDEHVLFTRNDDYWGELPDFEEYEVRIIPEASTRVAELLTGGVDIVYDIMPQDQERIDDNPGTSTEWQPTDTGFFLNQRRGPNPEWDEDHELYGKEFATEDVRIRRAVEKSIDKYELRDYVGGEGEAFRARIFQPLPEGNPDLWGEDANLYDPERARELMEDAGYDLDAGEAPSLTFHAREDYPYGDLARIIEMRLEEAGFEVDLRLKDETTFQSEIYFPINSQELMLNDLGGNMNPFFGTRQYHSDEERMQRYGKFPEEVSEDLDPLLEAAWDSRTPEEERIEAYHEASEIMADNNLTTGLFQHSSLWGMSDRVEYEPRFDGDLWGQDIKKAE